MGTILNEDILKIVLNDKSFAKYEAASIVGGLKRLNELCRTGRIRYTTKEGVPHSRWSCNAWDVIKHAKLTPYKNSLLR